MTSNTILLVEDNAADAELTLDTLREALPTARLVWVKDGAQALEYLFGTGAYADNPPPAPKVVLLDLRMPRLDGSQVLKILSADRRTRLIPVVVLTSSQEERDIVESYDLGANAYVVKPVDSQKFTEAVRELGIFWDCFNRNAGE